MKPMIKIVLLKPTYKRWRRILHWWHASHNFVMLFAR